MCRFAGILQTGHILSLLVILSLYVRKFCPYNSSEEACCGTWRDLPSGDS